MLTALGLKFSQKEVLATVTTSSDQGLSPGQGSGGWNQWCSQSCFGKLRQVPLPPAPRLPVWLTDIANHE